MAALDLSPGAEFAGQFRVVRPLAKGGMGAVYVVEQLGTGRERALKLMHPILAADARAVERFTREAQVSSRIESDHVVEVIAAGVDAPTSTPWLCMELLKGETLDERITRAGRMSLSEASEAFRQLGHALSAAHRAGIVHRDLKPENVFLATPRRQGVPFTLKILDFGVAAIVQDTNGPKTTQGVGSPMWMAPEQTNVGRVTPATDVWALGLIAFFVLTGKPYWRSPQTEGSSLTALLVEIMVDPIAPASARARDLLVGGVLPEGFDAWFARTVERDPTQRFADAAHAIEALLAVLDGKVTGVTQPIGGVAEAFGATAPSGFAGTGLPGTGPAGIPSTQSMPTPSATAPATPIPTLAGAPPPPSSSLPPGAAAPTPASAPAPRRWVWALALVLATIATCVLGSIAIFALGVGTAVQQLESGPRTIEGEHGEHIEVSSEGIVVTTPDAGTLRIGLVATTEPPASGASTADEEAEADEVDDEGADDEEEEDDEADDEGEEDDEEEEDDAEEEVAPPAPHRARSAPARPAPASAATQAARRALIDPCWRATYEGETPPPSARWTFSFVLDGSGRATNVRITGPTGGAYDSFRRCVVSRVSSFTSPDGSSDVAVTLP